MAPDPAAGPPEDPAAGPPEDPEAVARRILLRRLTEQPRSRAELARALARRNVPDGVAATLLDRFEEVGLVDDAAFAQAWVESRHSGRGLGRRALGRELRRKGVPDETAREALGRVDDQAERDTARRLVERRLPAVRRLDRTQAQRRLVGMLARKGYGPALAFRVVREATEQANRQPGDPDDFGDQGGLDDPDDIGDISHTPLDLR